MSGENQEPVTAEPLEQAGDEAAAVDEAVAEEGTEQPSLEEQLEEAQRLAAEYLDGWQRARAEFANYRRRQDQQQKQAAIAVKARVLSQLIPVIDDLARAIEAVPAEAEDPAWLQGLAMVDRKWIGALEKVGLVALSIAPGDAFDPTYHEALTHEPNDEYADGTVIEVLQRGYTVDDVVLRPALVRVSSGPAAQPAGQPSSAAGDEEA